MYTPTPTPTSLPAETLDMRILSSSDDIEESLVDGTMYLDSGDLELGRDPGYLGDQAVGLRFQNVAVPRGAPIRAAYLEFVTDDVGSTATVVEIRAQAADDAPAFSTFNYDLTSRPRTQAYVTWDIPAWNVVGERHQSPDLSALVQEVVNRAGWNANNSLVFAINGTGTRSAESYEGQPAAAPLLHVEYSTGQPTPTCWLYLPIAVQNGEGF
jgi:hypothetical protein